IKIGRQTNAKTVPGERNACFDSKVLSRTHAEIWEHSGKIYIKDVKSSNGTFINGERLSQEGIESHPHELKSEDIVEFGIDIVSEDNRMIVHHKVAAKVYCVLNAVDANLSARELQNYQGQDSRSRRANGASQGNPLAQSGQPVMSAGGKPNALSFNHVLHKLQTELAKSKETGSALQNLTTAMTDIQDTLGGGLPPSQNGSAAQFIPPQFRSTAAEAQAALAGPHGQQAAAFISLQNQLTETHTSLDSHLDKIRQLESKLQEHESLRAEISSLRSQMEQGKQEMELVFANARGRQIMRNFPGDVDEDDEDGASDDDDARSTITLMANEDGTQRARPKPGGRAKGIIPSEEPQNGHSDDETPSFEQVANGVDKPHDVELESRLQSLSAEVAEAVALSRTLQTQHSEAITAVKLLTDRVGSLEHGIQSRIAEEVLKSEQRWDTWRAKFEEGWRKERESWNAERERLRGVVREWEEASRRAHEEEEERELNESLSEDGFEEEGDEDEDLAGDDAGGRDVEEGELLTLDTLEWQGPNSISPKSRRARGSASSGSSGSGPRKPRRRRPSNRAALAVSALKGVAGLEDGPPGSTTPRAELSPLDANAPILTPGSGRLNGKLGRGKIGGSLLSRTMSGETFKKRSGSGGKSSSESGKDSADTLKEEDEGNSADYVERNTKEKQGGGDVIPLGMFSVLVVAVVAGAIYYKNRE
ncbi:hypothetical protein BD324DRAFT_629248, partial [Kockovaella imperatae]